jgi:hypothetical protein
MFTIYTYWNSASMIQVLNAVVLVVGGADFLGLMKAVALLGLLSAAGIGMLKISFKEPAAYLVMLLLFYSIMFVPKVTVVVQDVRTGQVGTVANVPLGIAFFAGTTSHIGKFLTETFETAFAQGDELSFSRTGMAWGASSLKTLASVRPTDPKLQEAFAAFVRSCVTPELINDSAKYNGLVNSTNILETLAIGRGTAGGWLNPGRVVELPNNSVLGYEVRPCIQTSASIPNAYDIIVAWLATEAPRQRMWLARTLLTDVPQATANTLLASYLPGAEGALIGTSRAITDQIMQSMTVSLMNESAGSLALVRNDPGAVTLAVGAATASAQAASSYRVLGMIGAEALPKMRNMVEIMLICVFPIVLLVIIVAGENGGSVIKTYAMTSVWVQLWAPLYAIVNAVLTPMTAGRFSAQMEGLTQTMRNSESMMQTGFSEQAMAGALVMAVPVIAYALVRGGEVAMSGAMGALSAPASGAATSAGAAAGVGNHQFGNTSWGNHSSNNTSGNKWDDAGSMSQGSWSSTQGLYSTKSSQTSGETYGNASQMNANMGAYGAQEAGVMNELASSAIQNQMSKGSEAAQNYTRSVSAAHDKFASGERGSGGQQGVTSTAGTGRTGSQKSAWESSRDEAIAWSQGTGLTKGEAFALTALASASGGIEAFGSGFKASGSAQAMSKDELAQKYEAAKKAGQSTAFKEASDAVNGSQSGVTTSNDSTTNNAQKAGTKGSLTDANTYADSAKQSFQTAQALTDTLQSSRANSAGVTQDLANRVQQLAGGANGMHAAIQDGSIKQLVAAAAADAFAEKFGGAFNPASKKDGGSAAPPLNSSEAAPLRDKIESGTRHVPGAVEGGQGAVNKAGDAAIKAQPAVKPTPRLSAGESGTGKPETPQTVRQAEAAADAAGKKTIATGAAKTTAQQAAVADAAGTAIDRASGPGALPASVIPRAANNASEAIKAAPAAVLRAVMGNSLGDQVAGERAPMLNDGAPTPANNTTGSAIPTPITDQAVLKAADGAKPAAAPSKEGGPR